MYNPIACSHPGVGQTHITYNPVVGRTRSQSLIEPYSQNQSPYSQVQNTPLQTYLPPPRTQQTQQTPFNPNVGYRSWHIPSSTYVPPPQQTQSDPNAASTLTTQQWTNPNSGNYGVANRQSHDAGRRNRSQSWTQPTKMQLKLIHRESFSFFVSRHYNPTVHTFNICVVVNRKKGKIDAPNTLFPEKDYDYKLNFAVRVPVIMYLQIDSKKTFTYTVG